MTLHRAACAATIALADSEIHRRDDGLLRLVRRDLEGPGIALPFGLRQAAGYRALADHDSRRISVRVGYFAAGSSRAAPSAAMRTAYARLFTCIVCCVPVTDMDPASPFGPTIGDATQKTCASYSPRS